jgi:hypothetical protein
MLVPRGNTRRISVSTMAISKVKFTLKEAMKEQRGSGGIALLLL